MNAEFWTVVDKLVETSHIVVDRPKGSAHPRYSNAIYPLDYGYLAGTSSMDGNGIDVWLGSLDTRKANSIICAVDLLKRDSEIKLLVGCTEEEKSLILSFHNDSAYMKGIMISREELYKK